MDRCRRAVGCRADDVDREARVERDRGAREHGADARGAELLGVQAAGAEDAAGRIESRDSHNPIDRFLEATRAEQEALAAPRADKRTLVRRAYLDLLGLPPTPAEVEAFVADQSAGRVGRPDRRSCSRRRTTASAGAGTGSTSRATPTRTASSTTTIGRTPGAIATTSSRRSTTTSRTTSSSPSRSPATRWTTGPTTA